MAKRKTFKDLQWDNNEASLTFRNGYQVVVRTGKGTATTIGAKYEVEMIPMNSKVMDDRVGYCTEDDVTEILYEIQQLTKL
jgi:hypothetical protein